MDDYIRVQGYNSVLPSKIVAWPIPLHQSLTMGSVDIGMKVLIVGAGTFNLSYYTTATH